MIVLITGGAGFIGSHLIRLLVDKGIHCVVVDNLSSGNRKNLIPEVDFYDIDIRSDALETIFKKYQFDAVVHLAGQILVSASIEDPVYDMTENINGSVNVMNLARKYKVDRVLFSSTAAAYGDVPDTDLPVKEDHILAPASFYGLSKVTVERYLKLYHEIYSLNYITFRFANVYGERQGDGGEGGVISIFAKRIAEGKDITIFGDGKQTRDFIYAGDIARGIYKALLTENVNCTCNLSSQTETSLLDLVQLFSKISGREIRPSFTEAREGDIYRSVLCHENAGKYLDWKPEMKLSEGLRRTYEYFLNVK